jgi:hypothetical protein
VDFAVARKSHLEPNVQRHLPAHQYDPHSSVSGLGLDTHIFLPEARFAVCQSRRHFYTHFDNFVPLSGTRPNIAYCLSTPVFVKCAGRNKRAVAVHRADDRECGERLEREEQVRGFDTRSTVRM